MFVGCASNPQSVEVHDSASMPSDAPLSRIKNGMGLQQVITILGPPTDQESGVTGKAFIPFYFGSDSVETRLYYKGLGQIKFSSGGLGGGPKVKQVIVNPNEDGFKGDFANEDKSTPVITAPDKKVYLSERFRGTWKGTLTQPQAGEYGVTLYLDKEPFKIDYHSLNCSGTVTLFTENGASTVFREEITSGGTACTNTGIIKLEFTERDKADMTWSYLSGQFGASGTLSKLKK